MNPAYDQRSILRRAKPFGLRRSRPAHRTGLVLALLATVSLSACGGEDEDGNQPVGAPEGALAFGQVEAR
jgi:hypothetical protein